MRALVLGDALDAGLRDSFAKYELEIVDKSLDEIDIDDIDLVILKNYIGKLSQLANRLPHIPLISIGPVASMQQFIKNNGKALINSAFFGLDLFDEFFGRFLEGQTSSLNLEYLFKDKLEALETLKITGDMSTGYYMDLIALDLYERDYNVIAFKEFFTALISYLSYLKQGGIAGFPFEIEYGEVAGKQFVLQCAVNISHFVTEYISDGFLTESLSNPLHGLLKRCANLADIFDISHLERKSRLVFTAVWLKRDHSTSAFNSFFLNRINSFNYQKEKNFSLLQSPKVFRYQAQDQLKKKLEDKKLPGFFTDMFLNRDEIPSLHPTFFMRLVRFIQEEVEEENYDLPLEQFDIEDVKKVLANYPDQEMIAHLKDTDYEFIKSCLHSVDRLEQLEHLIEEVTALVESGELNDALLEKFKVNMQEILQEDIQRVKGGAEERENTQLVKGEGEQLVEENIHISGAIDELSDEEWKLKRMQLVDEAVTILDALPTEELTLENFKEALVKLVAEKFDMSEEQALVFLDGLFASSMSQVVNAEVVKRLQEEIGADQDVKLINLLKNLEEKDKSIEQLHKRVEELQAQVENKVVDVQDRQLLEKYNKLQHLNQAKERLILALKGQLADLQHKIAEGAEGNVQLLTKQVEQQRRTIDELQKKLQELQFNLERKPELHTTLDDKVVAALNRQKDMLLERARKAEEEQHGLKIAYTRAKYKNHQLEEKLKHMSKKLKASKLKNSVQGLDKSREKKIKQLEHRIDKLNKMNEQAKAAVANAKRDAMKFKNENMILQNQINELRRKLAAKS